LFSFSCFALHLTTKLILQYYIDSYIHAEGYSGGALKHGPFALIEGAEGKQGATPIIMIILDDEFGAQMRIAAEEVKARGAEVIIITDDVHLASGLDPNPIVIPRNGPLTALTAVLPLQVISFTHLLLVYHHSFNSFQLFSNWYSSSLTSLQS
jgi:hypothetical protein